MQCSKQMIEQIVQLLMPSFRIEYRPIEMFEMPQDFTGEEESKVE